jgi:pyrrolidone-carboxylate peptidase
MKLLVTGFGPFGNIAENPSSELAQTCGYDFRILEVSFRAVDELVESVLPDYDALLAIGVNAAATKMAVETVARNDIGSTADVLGEVRGPGPIDPRLPQNIAATLWTEELLCETEDWTQSTSAGNYLCNYLFYRAASCHPLKKVGFLHVPTFETLKIADQERILGLILRAL